MSFICQKCGKPQPNGVAPHKVVTKKRVKIYPPLKDKDGIPIGNEGKGLETVEELDFCQKCARSFKKTDVEILDQTETESYSL